MLCYGKQWYDMTKTVLREIVCYGMRFQCYAMVYAVKNIFELIVYQSLFKIRYVTIFKISLNIVPKTPH